MAKANTKARRARILYCHCAYAQVVPRAVKEEVLRRVLDSGTPFDAVPDLCALSARRDVALQHWAAEGHLKIAACFPRAVRWLFAAADAPLPEKGVEILNMRTASADTVIAGLVGTRRKPGGVDPAAAEMVTALRTAARDGPPNGWKPWFPVIDGERCVNCQQCLSFCLFGVYGRSEQGRVEVRKPHQCKTDCPACARVCPEAAIIFPKYGAAPINGDEVRLEDTQRESMQIDVSTRLGGDIYQALRNRTTQVERRFSKAQDEERALQERKRCLEKFRAATRKPKDPGAPQSVPASGRKSARRKPRPASGDVSPPSVG